MRELFGKKLILGSMLTLLLMPSVHAEEKFSLGAGIGAMYSGLGINVGLKTERQLQYLAVGCMGYNHSRGGDDIDERNFACGAGVGVVRTDLFSTDNTKHGLGLYIGMIGSSNKRNPKVITRPGSITVINEIEPIYGIGVSYIYFWNGIFEKGLNLGITPAIGFDNGTKGNVLLQIGYQFK